LQRKRRGPRRGDQRRCVCVEHVLEECEAERKLDTQRDRKQERDKKREEKIRERVCVYVRYTATHCTSQFSQNATATHCNSMQHTAKHSNTLQHTATHCNTLRRSATTHCNIPQQHTATQVQMPQNKAALLAERGLQCRSLSCHCTHQRAHEPTSLAARTQLL